MKMHGWLVGAMVTGAALWASPARADAILDPAHEALNRGVGDVVAGKFVAGEKEIRDALKMDPALGFNAHYNLAVALKNEGRFQEALPEYHAAFATALTESDRAQALYGVGLTKEAMGEKNAWDEYLAFARPKRVEQPAVQIAEEHRDVLNGVRVPGTQKASR